MKDTHPSANQTTPVTKPQAPRNLLSIVAQVSQVRPTKINQTAARTCESAINCSFVYIMASIILYRNMPRKPDQNHRTTLSEKDRHVTSSHQATLHKPKSKFRPHVEKKLTSASCAAPNWFLIYVR